MIEITSICNFACTYCVSPHKVRKKAMMEPELFSHIVKQLPSLTTKPVRLHIDGEPTSHPHFFDFARQVNGVGLPVSLATNGSLLKPEYTDLWMNLLVSISTSPEELALRHPKLKFEKYIDTIAEFTSAWAKSNARQALSFQIVNYYSVRDPEYPEYNAAKNAFLQSFIERTGLSERCEALNSLDDPVHHLRRKAGGQRQLYQTGCLKGRAIPDQWQGAAGCEDD